MHPRVRFTIPLVLVLVLAGAGVWYYNRPAAAEEAGALSASGTVEAVELSLAPELGGRVSEILVQEGERVDPGQILFRLDGELLQAQRRRAETALETARAGIEAAASQVGGAEAALSAARAALDAAEVGVETARLQVQMALDSARLTELPARERAWRGQQPYPLALPEWYFSEAETLDAARSEVEAARADSRAAQEALTRLIDTQENEPLSAAEARLVQAQETYQVAGEVLARAKLNMEVALEEAAQDAFDAAEEQLKAAQDEYDRLLDATGDSVLLEARARVAVAQARYEIALDRLARLQTGDQALSVQAAELGLRAAEAARSQAGAALDQAERGLEGALARQVQAERAAAQAQAELDLLDLQIEKLNVYAPAAGRVTGRLVEPGEVVNAGMPVLTLGYLDGLTITVYLPEDQYGQVQVGAAAAVEVDSFPAVVFEAQVLRIADRAEFTPRNVQTQEGRRSTVFAVELSVTDPDGHLKPGMPADVVFQAGEAGGS